MSATAKPLPSNDKQPVNRREFLYYLGGASLALLTAGTCAGITWYTTPDPRAGEVSVNVAEFLSGLTPYLPPVLGVVEAEANICVLQGGLIVFSGYCSHEDYPPFVRWVDTNQRFECPNCGSKYTLEGSAIDGPTQRGLDRFAFRVTISDGTVFTSTDGNPIELHDPVEIIIDTHAKILGAARG